MSLHFQNCFLSCHPSKQSRPTRYTNSYTRVVSNLPYGKLQLAPGKVPSTESPLSPIGDTKSPGSTARVRHSPLPCNWALFDSPKRMTMYIALNCFGSTLAGDEARDATDQPSEVSAGALSQWNTSVANLPPVIPKTLDSLVPWATLLWFRLFWQHNREQVVSVAT